MDKPTLTPFQLLNSDIIETDIGVFINMPAKQAVLWKSHASQTVDTLQQPSAYSLIRNAAWARPGDL